MLRRTSYSRYGWAVVCLCFLLFVFSPAYASASNSGWDTALATVEQLHDSLSALELVNQLDKRKIQTLRKQNNDQRKEVDRKIKLIDKEKLEQLKLEADRIQKRHEPLLAKYIELGKKAAEAKKRKDKKSALRYDLERNRIKVSSSAARKEIKSSRDTLTAARKQASAKAKLVRDALEPIQAIKKQITAENKKIAVIHKSQSAANKRYRTSIKQGNALTAALEINIIVGELNRVQASQKKIYEWEGSIRNLIRTAEGKL
ncbi:hypothetical protein NQ117_01450 [Paenibacillus sp. SC116]|uniref:hypothetical protein n=1 Tax=Paenibacillus sp. SC116 TaxID=2968986 RepID=UPI00215A7943|nr:hypothetical protein [Paenibacillus sp. SC116]MCR8842340.1 hypothetical protein [Paenibacillus sp. SC116]